MTDGQKAGTTLATVLAILALVMGSQSLPFIQWLFGEIKVMAGLPLFAPVMIAVVVGAAAPAWLPHLLPASWPAHRTKRVTRLLGFGIAFVMVAVRYPGPVGLQYGLFAGSGAYVLWTMVASFVYRTMPQTKPKSLDDDAAGP